MMTQEEFWESFPSIQLGSFMVPIISVQFGVKEKDCGNMDNEKNQRDSDFRWGMCTLRHFERVCASWNMCKGLM